MKRKCQLAVSTALGRSIDGVEAQAIEQHILRAMREDWRTKPETRSLGGVERVLAAAQRLARDTLADAMEARAKLAPLPQAARRYQQFGGLRSKHMDPTEAWHAQKMAAQGIDPEQIWRETGWWRNPTDGKWRYEIDDSRAKLRRGQIWNKKGVYGGRLGDVLDFPELFAAYPSLADVHVRITTNADKASEGAYLARGSDQIIVNAASRDEALGIVLHEVQHAIQAIEGFHGGGNPKAVASAPEFRAVFDDFIARGTKAAEDELALQGLTLDDIKAKNPDAYAEMLAVIEDDAAMKVYVRIAGELEARNVENRRGQGMTGAPGNKKLSSRARRATPPSETFDLPISEAIVELEDGARYVALKSVAGDALGPRPGADAGSRGPSVPGRQESRRSRGGAGDGGGFKGAIRRAIEAHLETARRGGDDASPLSQDARGETFIPEGGVFADPGVVVTLFETADHSTPFHEFGHVFLEVMQAYGARENAPAELTADIVTVRKWLKAEGDGPLTRDQHEQFARGMEAYVREGRAPSPGLTRIFQVFRDWLVGLYRSVAELDVELTPEIRAVFDRLLKDVDDAPLQALEGGAGRLGRSERAADPAGNGSAAEPAGSNRSGDGRGGAQARDGDRGGGKSRSAPPEAAGLNPAILARDPDLREIADDLVAARDEIDALERQGRIAPEEAEAARAQMTTIEKAAALPELMRAAAFCLQHGARVNGGPG